MNRSRLFALPAAAILAGTALLTSCSSITHGTITGKQCKPERQWTYMQPVYSERCTTSGRTGSTSCSSYISTWIPIPETDPACWELELRHGGDTGSVCVSEQAWNGARVGGTW